MRFKKPPIIILNPGKVGSSSVYNTLKKNVDNHVFHIHNFAESRIAESREYHLKSDRKSLPLHLIVSTLLKKKLQNYRGKIYVITIIREPISRAVSSFFQNSELYSSKVETEGLKIHKDNAKEIIYKRLETQTAEYPEFWLNKEIKENFDIDVFKQKYDNVKGYNLVVKGNITHLLMKMENLNEVFPKAIQELLLLKKPLELLNINIGEQKHYAESYKLLKQEIEIPFSTLEKIISSKYFQHFYLEEENRVKHKWMKK